LISLSVQFSGQAQPFGQAEVGKVVKALEEVIGTTDTTIGIRVVDSQEVREINKKYAGKDEETDVLSFNYQEGKASPKDEKAGDIVISYQHVLTQARAGKTSAETELALLVLHGILHILGYDHQNQAERQGSWSFTCV